MCLCMAISISSMVDFLDASQWGEGSSLQIFSAGQFFPMLYNPLRFSSIMSLGFRVIVSCTNFFVKFTWPSLITEAEYAAEATRQIRVVEVMSIFIVGRGLYGTPSFRGP